MGIQKYKGVTFFLPGLPRDTEQENPSSKRPTSTNTTTKNTCVHKACARGVQKVPQESSRRCSYICSRANNECKHEYRLENCTGHCLAAEIKCKIKQQQRNHYLNTAIATIANLKQKICDSITTEDPGVTFWFCGTQCQGLWWWFFLL